MRTIVDYKVVKTLDIMQYLPLGFELYGSPFCCKLCEGEDECECPVQAIIKYEEI